MDSRPIWVPTMKLNPLVQEIVIPCRLRASLTPEDKKLNVVSLHRHAELFGYVPLLEVSTKSESRLGRQLSAFNLTLNTSLGRCYIESLYQGSKVFDHGLKDSPHNFPSLYTLGAWVAKKYPALRTSGNILGFDYFGVSWPSKPKTMFYDWLYLTALLDNPQLLDQLVKGRYAGFTDIEFIPKRAINSQARACAVAITLSYLGLFKAAMVTTDAFKAIYEPSVSFESLFEKNKLTNFVASSKLEGINLFSDL